MGNVIRIVVADDNDLMREMIVDLLSDDEDIEVVGEASDGAMTMKLIKETHPDIVLLDLVMPMVDGLGVGDVGNIVIRDRKHLSEDGLIVVVVCMNSVTKEIMSGPDVISRGFVYVREAEPLMENIKLIAKEAIEDCAGKKNNDWTALKNSVKNKLSQYLYEETKRSPMILPIIVEV